MLCYIPIIGYFLSFILAFCISVPFYFLWNWLAPTYFYFVPPVYQNIPFWSCVGLWMLLSILKCIFKPSININNSNTNKDTQKIRNSSW